MYNLTIIYNKYFIIYKKVYFLDTDKYVVYNLLYNSNKTRTARYEKENLYDWKCSS